MDTKKYEVFEKTVELSSLTKAAQELGLTQSGVSHMLSAIEAELQLPLLKRTRTGARLTPEGERMMPYIHEIVRQEKLLRQAAASLHTLVTGKIRIGTFTSVATHLARRRQRRSRVYDAPCPSRLSVYAAVRGCAGRRSAEGPPAGERFRLPRRGAGKGTVYFAPGILQP